MGTGIDRATLLRRASAGLAAAALGGAASASRAAAPPLSELDRATRGALMRPGSAGYASGRAVANARYSGTRPLAILRAADASDVRRAVRWCARHGVRIAARSGGHSYAGYSTVAGGLVVDLSALDGIRIAPDGRTVQVGAGALLIDVYTALARRGLTIPGGSCPTVGVGGLALGGGVGFASRAFGTTCDNISRLTVVTADGRALGCDARTNGDLYWASRGGGGGNFGIATGFTFRTHAARSASYFFAAYDWDDAAEAVAAWQRWAPSAPPEAFSICSLSTGSGRPVISIFGQYLGGQAAMRRALAPLTRAAPPRRLTVGTQAYLPLQMRWAGCLGESAAACRRPPRDLFAAKSDYVLTRMGAAGIATMIRFVERRQAQSSRGSGAILLDSYGGAINEVEPDATAFVHRTALYSCQYLAYWSRAADAATGLSWIRAFHAAMRPHVSKFAYQNYIDPELSGWARAYYGANLARLREIKRRRDPDRVFRFRQAIPA
ncbi:MAG: FAD-binding oxidoreductase [Thermoleophilia bacterium]